MKLTISEQEILKAIRGIERLKKRHKRHDKAIEKLKAKGVIVKGKDNILRILPKYDNVFFIYGDRQQK